MLGGFKIPKDSEKYQWTRHSIAKMHQYGISEGMVRRVVRAYIRKEKGIAPSTTAVMQPRKIDSHMGGKPTKWREELWVMYRTAPKVAGSFFDRKRVISAWRYPGMSPQGQEIPIPEDIREELEREGV